MHPFGQQIAVLLAIASHGVASGHVNGVSSIYHSWGELSEYKDNAEDHFGVQFVGLPDGCQVVSDASILETRDDINTRVRSRYLPFSAMPSASQTLSTAP